jgi:hypothetical protein
VLRRTTTFAELQDVLARAGDSIHGIGPLTVYDTATRIGAYLRLHPDRVFLHAGTRDGAKALGVSRGRTSVPISDLPAAFHQLTPAQAEDCLCIYEQQLAAIGASAQRASAGTRRHAPVC